MSALALILACMGSAVALGVGMRGRRVGRSPTCAACGYELGDPPPARCSECGAMLRRPGAVARGQRRPYRVLAAGGALMLCLSLATAGLIGWGGLSGPAMARLKPTGWLLREIGPVEAGAPWPARRDALGEFLRRLADGRVTERSRARFLDAVLPADPTVEPVPSTEWAAGVARLLGATGGAPGERARVVGWLLDRQADPSAGWDGRWGDALEAQRRAGRLDDAAWERYLAGVAAPAVGVGDGSPAAGDTVPLVLRMRWRGGKPSSFTAWVEPEFDDGGTLVHFPRARLEMRPESPSMWWSGVVEGVLVEAIGLATVPEEPGRHRLTGRVRVTIENAGSNRAGPAVVVEHPVAAEFSVVEAAAPGTVLVEDEPLRARVEAALRRVAPLTAERTERGVEARGGLEFVQPPVALAFDVVWRERPDAGAQPGARPREWRVGWLLFERDHGAFTEPYGSVLEGFAAEAVDLVLRPSLGILRRHSRVREVWGGEIVLPDQKVRWSPGAP